MMQGPKNVIHCLKFDIILNKFFQNKLNAKSKGSEGKVIWKVKEIQFNCFH